MLWHVEACSSAEMLEKMMIYIEVKAVCYKPEGRGLETR
jgi:hypothetical protein